MGSMRQGAERQVQILFLKEEGIEIALNSIEEFYNYNSVNNFLFEEKGEKFLVFDNENNTTINDKEYANNFNLAFRRKNLFDNDDANKKIGSRKVSQDEDFLFNYMMH